MAPSLTFSRRHATFFKMLRSRFARDIVCEPRHASWFEDDAEDVLRAHKVGRVAADPVRKGSTFAPGGARDIAYFRMHGSPRMYYSPYSPKSLAALAAQLRASNGRRRWCIFDNTASGAAAGDALTLQKMLKA